MSTPGEHLSRAKLREEATKVGKEIEDWLEKIPLDGMNKTKARGVYSCKIEPKLFDMVKRLVKELPFIEVKVWTHGLASPSLLTSPGSRSRMGHISYS
jgi:hypothetical protein